MAENASHAEEEGARVVGCGGEGDEVGAAGEEGNGVVDAFFYFFEFVFFADFFELDDGEFAGGFVIGHFVNEKTVGFVGGDAACGGVGLEDVAGFFELHHVVSDGGRGDVKFVADEEGVAAHGFSGIDEVFHDGLEDFLFAVV